MGTRNRAVGMSPTWTQKHPFSDPEYPFKKFPDIYIRKTHDDDGLEYHNIYQGDKQVSQIYQTEDGWAFNHGHAWRFDTLAKAMQEWQKVWAKKNEPKPEPDDDLPQESKKRKARVS